LADQQAFNPIGVAGSLTFQRLQLPMQLPIIFVLHCRHLHNAPNLWLTTKPPNQTSDELSEIQPIRLCSLLPSIYLHTRRVDHNILDTLRFKPSMDPETVSACLVAAHNSCLRRQTESLFRSRNLPREALEVSGINRLLPRFLSETYRRTYLPFRCTQLQRQKQHRFTRILNLAGCTHWASSFLGILVLEA